ncbi:MAG TPA: proteasome subunit alpha [Actinomycetes bacterium]|nr:proteasome subunit alpha [Actinomycetes bacterium]
MSMPFYVPAEQQVKDKADYARKGIARGRSVVVLQYTDGILFVAENPSRALHKISEIYDRIAFAAVGKYNEFENLRKAGVRLADLQGYSYDRRDVTGRGLANAYAQTLGTIFTESIKPYEVEIVVAEVGESAEEDQIYRLTYDGSVADEHRYVAMGGSAEATANLLEQRYGDNPALPDALRLAVDVLSEAGPSPRQLPANQLEVAVLDRTRPKRKFQRLLGAKLDALLATTGSGKKPAEGKDGKVSGPAAGDAGAGGAEAGTGAGAEAGAEAGPAEGATDTGPGEPPPDRISGPDTPPAGTGD